ncbi:hypothetical protein ACIP5T_13495 [Microbacterium sp. NPDC088619]|uniref:hypothetical protein n=1 Tax=Microbacterium sp. NPDC088619 TaxID=3364196 RepID=UPI0037F556CB
MSDQQQNPEVPQDSGQPRDGGQAPHPSPSQPYPAQPQPAAHQAPPPAQPGQPYAQTGQPYTYPGQPHAQPGQPYGQPGQPYGVATPPSPSGQTAPRPGSLGLTALIVAVSAAVMGLFFQIVTPFMYMSVGYQFVELLSNLVNLIVLAGAGAGLVLGLIAVRRPAPHLLAAIAIGVGGSTVVGTLISWVSNLFYYFGF